MFGSSKLTKTIAGLVVGAAGLIAVSAAASATVLTVENVGQEGVDGVPNDAFGPGFPNGTLVQRVNLGAAGLTTINTIILTDISGGAGGDPGIFSGYDLDAVYLDRDGNVATTGDRIAFSSLSFTGGTIRPTGDVNQTPSAPNNIGAYFGTNTAGDVVAFGPGGTKNATLDTFDGVNVANRLNANGYLSFGDGGVLTLTFADILVGDGLYLIFGEVGGQGEKLQVEAPGQVPLPGAVWLFLSAIAVLFGMSRRRSAVTA